MSWDPIGLEASPAFRAYVDDLRTTWPETETTDNHGKPAGNGHSELIDMTDSQSGETDAQLYDTTMGRRAILVTTAATAAAAAGAGVASAAVQLDRDSEYAHNPTLSGTVTIAQHDRQVFDSPLAYIDDSGDTVSLAAAGGVVATGEEGKPHNPISLRADRINAEEFRAFPRGETFQNTDGDDEDLSALDAQHWTTDESGSAGSLTVENTSAASEGDALRVATSGQTDTDVATATFSDFEISSGEQRKRLQLVASIDALDDPTVVYVRVRDASDAVNEAWIDTNADSTAAGTIATGTDAGVVYQTQLGDLAGDLDTIEEIEIAIEDGNADLTIAGLNLERESEWSFGTREFENADEELETETIEEPTGAYSITSIDSLDENVFNSVSIANVDIDVEFKAGEIGERGVLEHEFSDAERYDQDSRLDDLVGWDLPSAYDLSYGTLTFNDTVKYPSGRYLEVAYQTGLDELPALDDDRDSWTDATGTYESGSIGDEITLSADVSGGEIIGWYADVLMNSNEQDDATTSGGIGGGAAGSAGGWFSGVRGILMSAVIGVGSWMAWMRSKAGV